MLTKIKRNLVLSTVFSKRINILEKKHELYQKLDGNFDAIQAYQLNLFNSSWRTTKKNIPFYKFWAEKHHLPSEISNLDELRLFPILNKSILQEHKDLIFQKNKKYLTVSTGGSSAEPTTFITSRYEKDIEYANTYLGRGAFDIKPLDKATLFWGHSHLFGSGLKGRINKFKRLIEDKIVSIERFSAYDLSVETIKTYVKALDSMSTSYLIGYTSSIFYMARYIVDNNIKLKISDTLKAIILTSETITDQDIKIIKKAFRVPVVIEYGMAETSVVAYSTPNHEGLKVFWDSFIAQESDDSELILTTLYNKEFPLINYATNDIITSLQNHNSTLLRIAEIKGRKRDVLILRSIDKKFIEIDGLVIIHIAKANAGVYSISYRQKNNQEIEINIVTEPTIDFNTVKSKFFSDFKRDFPTIDSSAVSILQRSKAKKTLAGKNIMRES